MAKKIEIKGVVLTGADDKQEPDSQLSMSVDGQPFKSLPPDVSEKIAEVLQAAKAI